MIFKQVKAKKLLFFFFFKKGIVNVFTYVVLILLKNSAILSIISYNDD